MPGDIKLINRETGKAELFTPEELQTALASGKYLDPGSVAAERFGIDTHVQTKEVLGRRAYGTPIDPGRVAIKEGQQKLEEEHDTASSKVKALLGGGASTLTAGLFKPFAEDAEFNPGWATAGSVGAMLATLPLGGEGIAAKGATVGEGIRAAELGEEAIGAGKALKGLASYSAPGIAGRAARAVESIIPGAGAASRIAKTAAGGAAWGATDELLNQALDPDKEFSGEQLLHAGMWGGGLGLAGGALGEGARFLGRGVKGAAKEFDELAALERTRPGEALFIEPKAEWQSKIPNRIGDVKVRDGIVSLTEDLNRLTKLGDEALGSTGIRYANGMSKYELTPLVEDTKRAVNGLKAMMADPQAPIGRLAVDLHSADTLANKLSSMTDQLPKRWSDPVIRSSFYSDIESRLAKLPVDADPHLVAAERLSSYLGAGTSGAERTAIDQGIKGWIGRQLIGSKLGELGKSGWQGAGVALLAEHAIEAGAGALVKGGLGLLALKQLGPMAVKSLGALFKDPAVGAALAGSTASVLNRSHVLQGSKAPSHEDPRQALRDFADRTRKVTPQQAASGAVDRLSHMAGAAPLSTAAAGDTAKRRHEYILKMLDAEDPVAVSPLGRPLPSAASARRVADALRVTSSPNAFLAAALSGQLTPQMLAAAETVFPATVQRLRTALLSQLASVDNPSRLPPETRRLISMILGPQAGGDERAAYRSAMDASVARANGGFEPAQAKAPSEPPGPVAENALASPAQKATHPAGGR